MPATENSNNFWNLGCGDRRTQPLNAAYDAKKRKSSRFRPTKNFGIPTARVPSKFGVFGVLRGLNTLFCRNLP